MKFEERIESNGSLTRRSQPYLGETHQANGKPKANGKAEAYVKQEANKYCKEPRNGLSIYTWQEIKKHNQNSDQWLVINRKVYNVTDWANRHPGGRRVLNHYAGEDATVRKSNLSLFLSVSLFLPPTLSLHLSPSPPLCF